MYTLRLFKQKADNGRKQIYLGKSYTVKDVVSGEDETLNIVSRVYGDENCNYTDGICIYDNDYAFIMTENGATFETVNRPKNLSK